MKKKALAAVLTLSLAASLLTACGEPPVDASVPDASEPMSQAQSLPESELPAPDLPDEPVEAAAGAEELQVVLAACSNATVEDKNFEPGSVMYTLDMEPKEQADVLDALLAGEWTEFEAPEMGLMPILTLNAATGETVGVFRSGAEDTVLVSQLTDGSVGTLWEVTADAALIQGVADQLTQRGAEQAG